MGQLCLLNDFHTSRSPQNAIGAFTVKFHLLTFKLCRARTYKGYAVLPAFIGLMWNVSSGILGVTVLALGNSVGDMVSSIVMARRGKICLHPKNLACTSRRPHFREKKDPVCSSIFYLTCEVRQPICTFSKKLTHTGIIQKLRWGSYCCSHLLWLSLVK